MQSTASRWALSALASRLHPPVPLSPRESEQLLELLTSSFRVHLECEHPSNNIHNGSYASRKRQRSLKAIRSNTVHAAPSSYTSAATHIDSILGNPLFTRRSPRRSSGSDAMDLMKDPLNWFLDEAAMGAADIPKATICLQMISMSEQSNQNIRKQAKPPGAVIAEWLRSSGTDTRRDFIDISNYKDSRLLIEQLVQILSTEDKGDALWRLVTYPPEQRISETGLSITEVDLFRSFLLSQMIKATHMSSRDQACSLFLRACRMVESQQHGLTRQIIQPVGANLVRQIMDDPGTASSPVIYEAVAASTSTWLGRWSRAVKAMLWLHHPVRPTPLPALDFIKDPRGAKIHVHQQKSRQQFLIQLCLGTAQQLLRDSNHVDAQLVMDFTRSHFADVVVPATSNTSQAQAERIRVEKEKENLEILSRWLPT